nr:type 2 lanthipeptide synthetase LanM [Bacillus subtilis]
MIEAFKRSAYLNERETVRKTTTLDHIKELSEWTNAIPHEMLEKRLEKDHLTREQLMLHIEQKDSPFIKKELKWIETFEELMDTYETSPLDYLSFQSLIHPFIIYAKKQIECLFKKVTSNLINIETVTQSITDALYARLHIMVMKCVILEVNIARKIEVLEGDTSEERFQYFMRQFNEDSEMRMEFFENYPVLSRLMTESTKNYLIITEELIERFLCDYEKIKDNFEGEFTRLERIKMDLGDTHQNGRTVAILEFESGEKLVYKPRQILIYKCFESLLDWLNDRGLKHKLKAAKSLDCQTYGWQEFIPFKECILKEEIRRFYYRQGVYTALFYVLGSSDFHAENIIANSEYPVPIDLETLFSQNLEMTKKLNFQSQLAVELNDSVFSTLMLPLPSLEHSIIDFDLSALGAIENQVSEKIKSIRIEGEGTDEIRITRGLQNQGSIIIDQCLKVKHFRLPIISLTLRRDLQTCTVCFLNIKRSLLAMMVLYNHLAKPMSVRSFVQLMCTVNFCKTVYILIMFKTVLIECNCLIFFGKFINNLLSLKNWLSMKQRIC